MMEKFLNTGKNRTWKNVCRMYFVLCEIFRGYEFLAIQCLINFQYRNDSEKGASVVRFGIPDRIRRNILRNESKKEVINITFVICIFKVQKLYINCIIYIILYYKIIYTADENYKCYVQRFFLRTILQTTINVRETEYVHNSLKPVLF